MNITILNDDKNKKVYNSKNFYNEDLEDKILFISADTKEESLQKIASAYFSKAKPIIYDKENIQINTMVENFDTALLDGVDFSALFFTSGTTGMPTGALKTAHNIETDLQDLAAIFKEFQAKEVIATVPFIHIYGFLVGFLLPQKLGIDLVFKEHFLPYDLLEIAQKGSVVVTTPLYIKSLLKLDETKDLKETLFISSTGALTCEAAREFIEKFNTNLIQIFGSTETGSIAYKKQDDELWKPFKGVEISLDEQGLLGIKSPYVSSILLQNSELKATHAEIQSFDYATIENSMFRLVGRDTHIIKVAGKRYSTLQIEEILEQLDGVKKVIVYVEHKKNELKDEVLKIFLEGSKVFLAKEIKAVLKQNFASINIPLELIMVEKIPMSAMGKKCIPIL